VSLDFLLRNQISKRRPLSPEFSVRPMSAVCRRKEEQSINWGSTRSRKLKLCLHPVHPQLSRPTRKEPESPDRSRYSLDKAEQRQPGQFPGASSRVSTTCYRLTHNVCVR